MAALSFPRSHLQLKRAYVAAAPSDGKRILVDRLWPRGISKQKAALDDWMKDLAPSTGLRQWFGHDPAKWDEFRRRYRAELAAHGEELGKLRDLAKAHKVTLVYGARDEQHNEAVVLRDVLEGKRG